MILSSIFRNSESYIKRWLAQVDALVDEADERVRVVIAEGDSTDNTYDLLRHEGLDVLKVEHHGPVFGSVRNELRWRQIGAVCNTLLCKVVREIEPNEPWVYVESDLEWDPKTMLGLIAYIRSGQHAVAPMSMSGDSDRFYDTWGHVSDGIEFHSRPPYHPDLRDGLLDLDSAGSCFVTSEPATQVVQFSHIDGIRGVGRSLRQNGFQLRLDPHLIVRHP